MEEINDQALSEVLQAACSAAERSDFQSIVTVAGDLRERAVGQDDPLRALVAALEYDLIVDVDHRGSYGPFGPMIETSGGVYPTPVNMIDGAALALWTRAIDKAPLALVRARLADLLWEARHGDRSHQYARRAIDEYVEASGRSFGIEIELSDGLQRALELAAQVNDSERHAQVVRAAVALASRALDSDEPMPGVSLRLIEALGRLRGDRRPPDLDELIDRAVQRYGDDPWHLEAALEIRARLTEPGDREPLHRRMVEAFAGLAERSTGLVKYAHYQHAIELAEQHGLHELGEALRRKIEELPRDDLDLRTVSAEIQVPREQIEEFIAGVVGDDDIESALTRFGGHIPTGLPEENREFVRQLMSEHPLQFLFTHMVIGPDNSLLRSVQGTEAQEEQALLDHEGQRASLFSIFAVDILEELRRRYGPVSSASSWFRSDLIEPATAERIGRAVEHYESGDPDSAACVLAPRLERIVRRMATLVGLTVTRSPDRGGRPGGIKGLGELLALLEGPMPEQTRRYLRVLLSEVTGLNLRNRVCHGLVDLVERHEAALLIHAACHLRLLVEQREHEDGPKHEG